MPNSAWTAALPDDVLFDAGVLFVGDTPIGVTRGGYTFDPQKEWRTPEFDGMRSKIAGLDRLVASTATLSATFLQFGADALVHYEAHYRGTTYNNKGAPQLTVAEAAALTVAEAAALTVSAVGIPEPAGELLAENRYVQDARLVFARGNGGTAAIVFPYLLCTQWTLTGNDKAEAEVQATFEARLDLTTQTTDDLPYHIEIAD